MPNVKRIGTEFENEFKKALSGLGYWVHFLVPDRAGKQPFDVLAVKDGVALAIDCKTCVDHVFRISRMEENQIMAFNKWMKCGNSDPIVAVKHNGVVYKVSYPFLKKNGKVDLYGGDGYEVFYYCAQHERE